MPNFFSSFSRASTPQPVNAKTREEIVTIQLLSPDIDPVLSLSLAYPTVGLGLMVGSLTFLLASFWLKICRLTALVQRREHHIKSLLAVDNLTGLANRKTFCQLGEQLLQARPDVAIAVLSLNLDRFQSINNEFGHIVGDQVLKQVGDRLRRCIGPQDVLARAGDNEFALLLHLDNTHGKNTHGENAHISAKKADNTTQIDNTKATDSLNNIRAVEATAKQMLALIDQPFIVLSQAIRVQGRLGIAHSGIACLKFANLGDRISLCTSADTPLRVTRFTQLLSQATIAMAQLKSLTHQVANKGSHPQRARYEIFQPEMEMRRQLRIERQRSLNLALERQELRP